MEKKKDLLGMGLRTVFNKSLHSNKNNTNYKYISNSLEKNLVLKYTFIFIHKNIFHNENVIIIR